jgi:hypothetical protein
MATENLWKEYLQKKKPAAYDANAYEEQRLAAWLPHAHP